ncbi:hypothetical protein TEA_010683 [Camellia sinensis var. sinensis]|uniref:L-2-hydroxyglutarate dehydrogenase, mitochondrial n=1 Tax=Camellia sinensis var. sinensis TaxID=542762 RepID=A0A4S4E5Y8_CAMSN|nr:hypothetical protein TEA_010683 [Camellia sinensis var. sinensis]
MMKTVKSGSEPSYRRWTAEATTGRWVRSAARREWEREEFQLILQALFCVKGRELLYKYCKEHDIPHKQICKLIVATGFSEIPKLNSLMNLGIENGVDGLRMIEGYEAMRIEPVLQCIKALLLPMSGIVDTHSLMLSLVGTTFSYNTTVIGGHREGNTICLHIFDSKALENWDGKSPLQPELVLVPNFVVNSAGLSAPSLAKRFDGIDSEVIPSSYYARGCYFTLSNVKSPPFKHLIYPIPEHGGLGVHVTLDLNGQVKFGLDVEWIDGVDDILSFMNKCFAHVGKRANTLWDLLDKEEGEEGKTLEEKEEAIRGFDYSLRTDRVNRFDPEIRKYNPSLKDGSLEPGYTGIRPKLSGPKQGSVDFVIQGEEIHGVPGLVNLFGIESPGLTSSMAIAEYVAGRLSRL